MPFGDVLEIFNSNNVLFDMNDGVGLEEIIFCINLRNHKTVPQNRTHPRNGPIDTPSFTLREFTIDAHITKDLYNRLESVSSPTTRGANQTLNFRMRAESQSNPADDITLTFTGFVYDVDNKAPIDNKFDVTFIIRADESTVVIT